MPAQETNSALVFGSATGPRTIANTMDKSAGGGGGQPWVAPITVEELDGVTLIVPEDKVPEVLKGKEIEDCTGVAINIISKSTIHVPDDSDSLEPLYLRLGNWEALPVIIGSASVFGGSENFSPLKFIHAETTVQLLLSQFMDANVWCVQNSEVIASEGGIAVTTPPNLPKINEDWSIQSGIGAPYITADNPANSELGLNVVAQIHTNDPYVSIGFGSQKNITLSQGEFSPKSGLSLELALPKNPLATDNARANIHMADQTSLELKSSGDGSAFLADDGTYHEIIQGGGSSGSGLILRATRASTGSYDVRLPADFDYAKNWPLPIGTKFVLSFDTIVPNTDDSNKRKINFFRAAGGGWLAEFSIYARNTAHITPYDVSDTKNAIWDILVRDTPIGVTVQNSNTLVIDQQAISASLINMGILHQAYGGTGRDTHTPYTPILGGTSTSNPQQSMTVPVIPVGTTAVPAMDTATANPSWHYTKTDISGTVDNTMLPGAKAVKDYVDSKSAASPTSSLYPQTMVLEGVPSSTIKPHWATMRGRSVTIVSSGGDGFNTINATAQNLQDAISNISIGTIFCNTSIDIPDDINFTTSYPKLIVNLRLRSSKTGWARAKFSDYIQLLQPQFTGVYPVPGIDAYYEKAAVIDGEIQPYSAYTQCYCSQVILRGSYRRIAIPEGFGGTFYMDNSTVERLVFSNTGDVIGTKLEFSAEGDLITGDAITCSAGRSLAGFTNFRGALTWFRNSYIQGNVVATDFNGEIAYVPLRGAYKFNTVSGFTSANTTANPSEMRTIIAWDYVPQTLSIADRMALEQPVVLATHPFTVTVGANGNSVYIALYGTLSNTSYSTICNLMDTTYGRSFIPSHQVRGVIALGGYSWSIVVATSGNISITPNGTVGNATIQGEIVLTYNAIGA